MQNPEDPYGVIRDAIGRDIRCLVDDQFSRVLDAADAAAPRKLQPGFVFWGIRGDARIVR